MPWPAGRVDNRGVSTVVTAAADHAPSAPRAGPTRRQVLTGLGVAVAGGAFCAVEATETPAAPSPFRLAALPMSPVDAEALPALARRFPGLADRTLNLLGPRPTGLRAGPGPVGDRLFADPARPGAWSLPWVPLFTRASPSGAAPAGLARALGREGALWLHDEGGPEPNVALYGNKARKYEYTLASAVLGGAERVSTVASLGSNHAVALTAAARYAKLGRRAPLAVEIRSMPQRVTPAVREKQRYLRAMGARVTLLSGDVRAGLALGGRWVAAHALPDAPDHFFVPPGGSSVLALLGHVDAALELAAEVEAGRLPRPDDVFLPMGSGGTAVGLALGFALLGWPTRLVATLSQDKPRWMGGLLYGDLETPLALSHARALFTDGVSLLATLLAPLGVLPAGWTEARLDASRLVVDAETWRPEYGVASPEVGAARDLAAEAGLSLDDTFAAKAFTTLRAWARDGRLAGRHALFWQTFHRFDPVRAVPALGEAPLPWLPGDAAA